MLFLLHLLLFFSGVDGEEYPDSVSADTFCDNEDVEMSICETADALREYGYQGEISVMTRIVYYESRYHPQACNLGETSHYYGLFQISNTWWCAEPGKEDNNGCDVGCATLLTTVEEQVKCAEIVRSLQGLEAWSVYSSYKEDIDNYVLPEECQDDDQSGSVINDTPYLLL